MLLGILIALGVVAAAALWTLCARLNYRLCKDEVSHEGLVEMVMLGAVGTLFLLICMGAEGWLNFCTRGAYSAHRAAAKRTRLNNSGGNRC